MKKAITVLLGITILSLTLVSCKKNSKPSESSEPISETASESVGESEESLPTSEEKSESASESFSESTLEPTSEPISEQVSEPTSESTLEPTSEPISEPVSGSEPISEPTSEPISEPVSGSEPISEPTSELESESESESVVIKHTANFYNYDGSLLYSTEVDEHGDATYEGPSPTRPDDDTYTYSFTGWNKSILDITESINVIAQYERFLVRTTKVIAIGDAHVCSDKVSQEHLAKTLEYVKNNSIDVVLFNGDTIDVAIEENYAIVDGILENAFADVESEDRPTFIFTMGNHEFYPSGTCRHQETDWSREFNNFRTFANKWMKYQIGQNENIYSQVINGITYICAFPGIDANYLENDETVYTAALGEYSNNDLIKLEEKLDEANALDDSMPIIVMTHWPWGETYGGPNYGVGTESEIAAMKAVLGKYPQAVNLTSHTHFSNLHDRDIGQSTYTSINVGTHCYGKYVSDCELDENGEVINYANIKNRRVDIDSQAVKYHGQTHFGLQLAFEREELKVDRVNFANESLYNHGTFVIPYGITKENMDDKFLYTSDKRSGPEFTFSGDDSLLVNAIERKNTINVEISFKDADQYYAAEGYKIVLEDGDGQELYSIKWASLFWVDLGERNTYSISTTLEGGLTNFVAKVYPIDFYGHYGSPLSLDIEVEPNIYIEEEAKEEACKDLFFTASIVDNKFDSEHAELNTYCLDTTDSSSGLSYKISVDAEVGGWPSIQVQLDKSYDLTSSGIAFDAKFSIEEGGTTKKWVSLFLYDSVGNQISTEIGNDFVGDDDSWLSCLITNSKINNNLKDGYDLTAVKFIRFNFNLNGNKGFNRSIWLDELHFVESPTLEKNLEMVEMDTGMCKGTAASITYSDVYGSNSTSARKFTFANSDLANGGADGRPRVAFSPDASGLSNIDVKNCTMSFDIKISSEFYDNNNAEKHTFVLDLYGSNWNRQRNVFNFFYNGAAGFYPENTDNGWIHLEQDMSVVQAYNSMSDLIRMEFQFFGLNDTTKTTAWVIIDNITFTPNA